MGQRVFVFFVPGGSEEPPRWAIQLIVVDTKKQSLQVTFRRHFTTSVVYDVSGRSDRNARNFSLIGCYFWLQPPFTGQSRTGHDGPTAGAARQRPHPPTATATCRRCRLCRHESPPPPDPPWGGRGCPDATARLDNGSSPTNPLSSDAIWIDGRPAGRSARPGLSKFNHPCHSGRPNSIRGTAGQFKGVR